jgi:hypothetical protein
MTAREKRKKPTIANTIRVATKHAVTIPPS